ncbi:MAG: hypothetical protein AB9903_02050 [Vulcanimicrobiota bacterium]
MKLWLLDADIIIDLLSMGIFNHLVRNHKVHVATTVINEIKYYSDGGSKRRINFRREFVDSGLVEEHSATHNDLLILCEKLPQNRLDRIHSGEIESFAVLLNEESLMFCSCDAAVIRTLPWLGMSHRGISAEKLVKESGLKASRMQAKHTESYFKSNIREGEREKIQGT